MQDTAGADNFTVVLQVVMVLPGFTLREYEPAERAMTLLIFADFFGAPTTDINKWERNRSSRSEGP